MEKLAAKELINSVNLLSILEPEHSADKARNVSPAPIVSILDWLKAGHEIEDQSLQFTKRAPLFPFVTITLSVIIFFLNFLTKVSKLEFLSLVS